MSVCSAACNSKHNPPPAPPSFPEPVRFFHGNRAATKIHQHARESCACFPRASRPRPPTRPAATRTLTPYPHSTPCRSGTPPIHNSKTSSLTNQANPSTRSPANSVSIRRKSLNSPPTKTRSVHHRKRKSPWPPPWTKLISTPTAAATACAMPSPKNSA